MSLTVFESKLVSADQTLEFNFISRLQDAETITGAVVTVTVWSGVDANPSAILLAPRTISQQSVLQRVTGGLVGVIYLVTCNITTSDAQALLMQGCLAVISADPFSP